MRIQTEDDESQRHWDETASCGAGWDHCESRLLLSGHSHTDRLFMFRMRELGLSGDTTSPDHKESRPALRPSPGPDRPSSTV
jgi:hypothetical protein